uniref:Aquaporin-3 n=1 Tax=Anolis carolinensis TaxID=28377 RepID=H9GHU1_ANOCA
MTYARFLAALRTRVRIRSLLLRQCLAEALGVFILIVITLSGAAQSVTSAGAKGGYFSAAFSGGISVMVAIHISGGVSGGHLNPAFSLAMCLLAQCPWWKLPIFSVVQIASAFVGAGTVYILYYDAIHHYSNGTLAVTGPRETASIFATYPAPYLSLWNGFFDQVLGTAVLVVSILALIDPRNRAHPRPAWSPWGWRCWWSRCAWPWAPTAAAPSTRPGTWARGSSPTWPGGAPRCSVPGGAGGGCRWWPRWWALRWARPSTSLGWASITP